MKPIILGENIETGKNIEMDFKMRQSTHMHVIGGSGKGKSKFLESILRQDIKEGSGLCLIDWHGTLYKDVLRYCAQLEVGLRQDFRQVILINPSNPEFVTGFNPFMNQGADIATQVNRRVDATIRPWGVSNTNEMPSFERLCKLLYTFAVEQKETLSNAAQLLSFGNKQLRSLAAGMITDSYVRRQWEDLDYLNTFKEWSNFSLSTENRLSRFLSSKTVKRFFGLKEGNIDLRRAMDEGHIVLVNLGSSQYLDRESARVFASLLLNEFFETGMLRAQAAGRGEKPKPFSLYLDEFQEYITDDVAAMLDQVRKGGLHMVLAHQHLQHLASNPHLLASILVNARIRAVFGGLTYEESCMLANEMFLDSLNERQIKRVYYRTMHLYNEEERVSRSRAFTNSQAKSKNRSTTEGSSYSDGFGSSTSHSEGQGLSSNSGTSYSEGYSNPDGLNGITDFTYPQQITEGHSFGESYSESETNSEGESFFSSSTTSHSTTIGEGETQGIASTAGDTKSTVFVPVPVQELVNEAEWSREEKVSRIAEMIKAQPQQRCFIKIDTQFSTPINVPFIKETSVNDELLGEYELDLYEEQGAIEGNAVDILLEESETKFLMAMNSKAASADAIAIDNKTSLARLKVGNRKKSIFYKLKENNPDLDVKDL